MGGSTYGFDVWPGHPEHAAVMGLLRTVRDQASVLRARVEAHNEANGLPDEGAHRVFFYVGQTVLEEARLEDDAGEGGGA